MYSTDNFF